MGALAAALGLPGLQRGHLTIRLAPSLIPGARLGARFLVPGSELRRVSRHHRLGCSASATWPKEGRGMGAFLEQREGEVLAVGLGAVAVAVSAVVAVARPGAVPVAVVSLAFLAAAARHQLAALFGVFAAHVNAAQDALAVHLSSARSNVVVWGTGNGASATVPTRDVESEVFEKRQEEIQGLPSAEVAAALTDMAKSVAHLTMVVASLDSKITTLEKEKAAFKSENNNRMMIDATKPTENGVYRVQNGNGAQLKWEEAVVKGQSVNEANSQVLEEYKPSEASLSLDKVFSESRARGKQAESSQSLKFSKAESEDTSMELFFQDAGVGEDVKLDVAAVEAMELRSDSQPDVQSKENTVTQPQLMDSSSVPSGVLDGVVRSNGRWSGDYELDGSESYRAVPTTDAKPDILRLKRIMSGAESGGVAANSQANSWIQNDATGSEMTRSKVKQPVVVLATQSDAGWDDDSSVSRSNGWADEDARASGRGEGAGRSATRSQDVRDEQGQSFRRRPRSEGSEEISSSGKADSGQRWRREGTSGASDADFGGNGSSSERNEGGNESRGRQSSSRRSYDSDEDRDAEPPTSQSRRPSPASPSYPSERTESFRNLPEPKSGKPDDESFQKILDEVEALLKEGREGLEGRIEVGVAERMLYEAAELCEKAVELRPSSLIAVGMWGNTLLLHGELKLRLSQNLRSIMPDPPSKSLNRRAYKEAEEEIQSYEATLQDVGEECEQLLVEAGRKYRLALSMDRTDMRALYNWGLALCYRGQLIAEEGGETAAQDADKVFLAAIDKFEAMMGLSDQFAAGALLNWGLAMRDRSRLRPLGSKERQRILAQAKEIFEEALRLDPNYGQARGAVAASIVELKRLQEYEEEPQDSSDDPSPSRGFRDWWG